MPLPSSGGVGAGGDAEHPRRLSAADLKQGSPASLHLLIEAMKRAYADRARYLGDPAFVNAPIETLTAKDYAAKLRASIIPSAPRRRASSSAAHSAARRQQHHAFSVVDAAAMPSATPPR
jgi:gamma-glutamyltranspeptidase/glutathione hydrolase